MDRRRFVIRSTVLACFACRAAQRGTRLRARSTLADLSDTAASWPWITASTWRAGDPSSPSRAAWPPRGRRARAGRGRAARLPGPLPRRRPCARPPRQWRGARICARPPPPLRRPPTRRHATWPTRGVGGRRVRPPPRRVRTPDAATAAGGGRGGRHHHRGGNGGNQFTRHARPLLADTAIAEAASHPRRIHGCGAIA